MMRVKNYSFVGVYLVAVSLLIACEKGGNEADSVENKKTLPTLTIPQVLVPAGEFIRGSNREDDLAMRQQYGFPAPLFVDEHPQKKIYLDAFKIDTYEVTNKQFKNYILQARRMLPYAWMSNGYAISEAQCWMWKGCARWSLMCLPWILIRETWTSRLCWQPC
ncbi:MAG: SUMF1/EgtB/PvdO family nonheme iron enzyme [Gammaproteobacteria bacterium]|nr:SUMF1/EgtB/PvdO family nonheme iron enzyme [Gammaproteobacteria bacterium]